MNGIIITILIIVGLVILLPALIMLIVVARVPFRKIETGAPCTPKENSDYIDNVTKYAYDSESNCVPERCATGYTLTNGVCVKDEEEDSVPETVYSDVPDSKVNNVIEYMGPFSQSELIINYTKGYNFPPSYKYNIASCAENAKRTEDGLRCECNPNYTYINGRCAEQCNTENTAGIYVKENDTCMLHTCKDGFTKANINDGNGNSEMCLNDSNIGDACIPWDPNSASGTITKESGEFECNISECKPDYTLVDGQCIDNSYNIDVLQGSSITGCVPDIEIDINGECKPLCQENELSNDQLTSGTPFYRDDSGECIPVSQYTLRYNSNKLEGIKL